jgi:restriction endonuclease Mrr
LPLAFALNLLALLENKQSYPVDNLIDGVLLVRLMMVHDVGVTEESRYVIKKIDLDYFSEE